MSVSQTTWSCIEWNPFLFMWCSWWLRGAFMGYVCHQWPRCIEVSHYFLKPSIVQNNLSLEGHWIKWGAILFTSAFQILVVTLNTVECDTSNRSDTDLMHSGFPRYQTVISSCFSISTAGRTLSLGTGISGQVPKMLTSLWAIRLESLKCWWKDESDIAGTILSTYDSVWTSAFLQYFINSLSTINIRMLSFLSCVSSAGPWRSSSKNKKNASGAWRIKPAMFVLKKRKQWLPGPLALLLYLFLNFHSH